MKNDTLRSEPVIGPTDLSEATSQGDKPSLNGPKPPPIDCSIEKFDIGLLLFALAAFIGEQEEFLHAINILNFICAEPRSPWYKYKRPRDARLQLESSLGKFGVWPRQIDSSPSLRFYCRRDLSEAVTRLNLGKKKTDGLNRP